ncbi:hypothetical protein CORC01_06707 [Colletotrichum orchidophilum]|uniref:Uncharacterized protein n=1 Tax=Colletotrichum orchidophilum TaxID=1209926 RepID=A0A1G4B9G4_9PEZI|nr:uncharacterized protein CORC01_06707 [Colletotrichum orchidophilum]OHE98038.1 hypothetical protein CORC01_06707 [Colletotrichum orchidophilum]
MNNTSNLRRLQEASYAVSSSTPRRHAAETLFPLWTEIQAQRREGQQEGIDSTPPPKLRLAFLLAFATDALRHSSSCSSTSTPPGLSGSQDSSQTQRHRPERSAVRAPAHLSSEHTLHPVSPERLSLSHPPQAPADISLVSPGGVPPRIDAAQTLADGNSHGNLRSRCDSPASTRMVIGPAAAVTLPSPDVPAWVLSASKVLFVIRFMDPTDWMMALKAVCVDRDMIQPFFNRRVNGLHQMQHTSSSSGSTILGTQKAQPPQGASILFPVESLPFAALPVTCGKLLRRLLAPSTGGTVTFPGTRTLAAFSSLQVRRGKRSRSPRARNGPSGTPPGAVFHAISYNTYPESLLHNTA